MSTYVLERKTTAEDISIGSVYWRRLTLDTQISHYILGGAAIGYEIAGVAYDVCRKAAQRPSEAKAETPEHYQQRVLEAITKDPERFYQRRKIYRRADELHEAACDTWQTATAIRDARRLKVFPRNSDSCMSWSRACDYLSVCCSEADIGDPILFAKAEKRHEELDGSDIRDGLELLTQSSLRSYRSCPRKYFYRYESRMRPLRPKAEPLRKGTAIHAALEVWSKTGGDVEAAIAALPTLDPFARAHEVATVIGYHARWSDEPWTYTAIEKEFLFPLVNPETGGESRTFILGGKLDGIVEEI